MSLINKSLKIILLSFFSLIAVNSYADWNPHDTQACRGGEMNPYNPPLPTECKCVGDRLQCTFPPAS